MVAGDVPTDERAVGPDRKATAARCVECRADQDRAEPAALVGLVDLGVGEHDQAGVLHAVLREPFSRRTGFDRQGHRKPSLLAPTLTRDGKIDWKNFSLDAWFLYLSSIQGFKLAPGGLYDTQVDLQHTKTPWLDQSPLSATLTEEELQSLWNLADVRGKVNRNGIGTFEEFRSTPRSQLLRPD